MRKRAQLILFLAVICAGSLTAGTLAYGVQGGFCPDNSCTSFGVEDLGTGAFTTIGTVAGFVPNNGGLARASSGLYTDNAVTNMVYQVDPATGNFTISGTANVAAGDLTVLGASGGVLYLLAFPSMNLYSFDPASGTTTLIGPTGIPAPASDLSNLGQILLTGLGGNLYADYYLLDAMQNPMVPDSLYRINPTTGQATLVGGLSGAQCLHGLGTVSNTLYGFGLNTCSGGADGIYTIDPASAAATFVTSETVGPILSVADVPEPSTAVLLLTVFLAFAVLRKRLLHGGLASGILEEPSFYDRIAARALDQSHRLRRIVSAR